MYEYDLLKIEKEKLDDQKHLVKLLELFIKTKDVDYLLAYCQHKINNNNQK